MIVYILGLLFSINTYAIVNGRALDSSQKKYLVHIKTQSNEHCTGSLIAPNKVLTALHCLIPQYFNGGDINDRHQTFDNARRDIQEEAKSLSLQFHGDSFAYRHIVESALLHSDVYEQLNDIIINSLDITPSYPIISIQNDFVVLNLKRSFNKETIAVIDYESYLIYSELTPQNVNVSGVGLEIDKKFTTFMLRLANWCGLMNMLIESTQRPNFATETFNNLLERAHFLADIILNHSNGIDIRQYSLLLTTRNYLQEIKDNSPHKIQIFEALDQLVSSEWQLYHVGPYRMQETSQMISEIRLDLGFMRLSPSHGVMSGVCQGDSGGPITTHIPGIGERLIGITISVPFCGLGMFANIIYHEKLSILPFLRH